MTKTKNSYFVLMHNGFDYNDEVYFPTEGGNPSKVFTSEDAARKAAEKENISEFRSLFISGDIREYGYSLDDVLDSKATESDLESDSGIFMRAFGKPASKWWEDSESKLVRDLTHQEWVNLIDCFNFNFCHVVEVEKG